MKPIESSNKLIIRVIHKRTMYIHSAYAYLSSSNHETTHFTIDYKIIPSII